MKMALVIGGILSIFRALSVVGWRPERSFHVQLSVCALLQIKHIQRSFPVMKLPFGSRSVQLSVSGQRKRRKAPEVNQSGDWMISLFY